MIPARRITLRSAHRWPDDPIEGWVTFLFFGRELEARVLLSEDEWSTWGPGFALEAEVYLRPRPTTLREERPLSLTRVDTTFYTAAGRITAVYGDGWYVFDCGIPLPVRLEDGDPATYAEGDHLVFTGELRLEFDE